MNDEPLETTGETGLSRRSLLVKGGLAAAGVSVVGGPAATGAFAAVNGRAATPIKIAVVTHGDTGSFWSVFKKGVDHATKDLNSRSLTATQEAPHSAL